MKKFRRFLSQNGLSIVFVGLFCVFIIAEYLTGYATYNQLQKIYHLPTVSHWVYLKSGHFLDGVFANWQAAILQLGSLIFFSVFLIQRGATHSKESNKKSTQNITKKPYGAFKSFIQKNSLSLAFGVIFLLSFVMHLLSGYKLANHLLSLAGTPPVSLAHYAFSSGFWFLNFQTWQAEYMAIAVYIILSVSLRQQGSPESKPVGAANAETGKANK